ncbi:MAG TPA: CHAP domain-containing protein [Candidatus Thiothrix moscowensis]|uniref:CHAP domain-containing protein n=1 Tax=unclassified Thiothrix TaxID=2636184 RepID=UPI0025E51A9C|nr:MULTISPECIES: CHAP domain-containing protein [unclassified Thiothrix]HRJ53553.1 CHAP domain-containing protein [Candidatus Thiothrix moscowensis]HRJ93639.1 CHAP domain-containing protein [Candidatus Thiothrix moscowensis]
MIAKSSFPLSAWILSATLLLGGCASLPETGSSAYPAGLAAVLPNTDGYGLLAKPAPLPEAVSKQAYAQAKQSCDTGCVTPAGKLLGVADQVPGYSNCQSTCARSEFSFMDLRSKAISLHEKPPADKQLHYVGLSYQCVEYARRWWMTNLGITFGDVDSAHDILYLTEGENIHTDGKFPLARSINGTAKRPPKRGDLLIYYPNPADPKWRHGHVAVVVGVDLQHGWVNVAEQNYNNLPWAQPNRYARQLRLFEVGGRYHIADVASDKTRNPAGGLVSGWIYPATAQ